MGALTGIIQMAMFLVISVAVITAVGFGLVAYYTATGQEEGE